MSEQDAPTNPEQTREGANGQRPGEAAAGAAAEERARLSTLEAELERSVRELEDTRRELSANTKRLDEIARAYSSLLNDQKEFRARTEREKARVLETERGNIAAQLLELSDEIDRALSAAAGDEGPLAQGVRLIRDGLAARLTAMGIERLALVGKPFDPLQAEAVDLVPVSDPAKSDVMVEEVRAGYRLGDRVLRPARVRVARHVPTPAEKQTGEDPGPAQA